MDSTSLYSEKAEIYARYRPDYHPEAFSVFQAAAGLPWKSVVVDIGSGTGMLTRHLLNLFNKVYAVEPSREMREKAEVDFGNVPGFHSVNGKAESTSLPPHSIDLIAVGQAIHWFHPENTLAEFQRIAKQGTWLLLAKIKSLDVDLNQALDTIFSYENGLMPKSEQPSSSIVPKEYYFDGGRADTLQFPHSSTESWECFLGGIGSAAYAPNLDHELYPKFVLAARKVFDRFAHNDVLTWNIATEISFGYLDQ